MVVNTVLINYWAVLAAAAASFVLGGIWYSFLFKKSWIALQGTEMGKGRSFPVLLIVNFVAGLITAFVLAHTVSYAGAETVYDALFVGFFTWLGYFAVTVSLGTVLWENKPIALYAINAGYWLVNILIMSLILTLWV